jgi:hypothetical protein
VLLGQSRNCQTYPTIQVPRLTLLQYDARQNSLVQLCSEARVSKANKFQRVVCALCMNLCIITMYNNLHSVYPVLFDFELN